MQHEKKQKTDLSPTTTAPNARIICLNMDCSTPASVLGRPNKKTYWVSREHGISIGKSTFWSLVFFVHNCWCRSRVHALRLCTALFGPACCVRLKPSPPKHCVRLKFLTLIPSQNTDNLYYCNSTELFQSRLLLTATAAQNSPQRVAMTINEALHNI